MNSQEVLDAVAKHQTISFDIFSTLVDRPYVKPTDLFKQMELDLGIPGFHDERVDAERRSRRRENPEISFDDIYEEIDRQFVHVKATELEYEKQVLKTNPEMKEVFDYAISLGKNVIIVSDMYLPADFLDEVLQKNGYSGYSKIYVSCEHKCNKHTGDLFKLVLEDLSVESNSILHIGDNKGSDYNSARRVGIDAFWYESMMDQYFSQNKIESRFYNRNKGLGASILVSMDALYWMKNNKQTSNQNYWYDTSYRFAGPVTYSFIRFIKQNLSDDVKRIFFVARDGYNLIRVYKTLYDDNISCEYIYAPRILRNLVADSNRNDNNYICWIVKFFANDDAVRDSIPSGRLTTKVCTKVYKENTEIFENLREKEVQKCNEYMSKVVVGDDDLAVVDATTLKYSSQKLIEHFTGERIVTGYYYNVLKESRETKHFTFQDRSRKFNNWSEVNVPELFMSSPEPPICGISDDYRPMFREDNSEHELHRISIHGDIMKGEVDYAADVRERFGDMLPEIDPVAVAAWTDVLINRRSAADKENILKMMWAPDFDHKEYYHLIFNWADLKYHLKNKAFSFIWKFSKN